MQDNQLIAWAEGARRAALADKADILVKGRIIIRDGLQEGRQWVEDWDIDRQFIVIRQPGHSTYVCSIGQTHIYTPSRLFVFKWRERIEGNRISLWVPYDPIFRIPIKGEPPEGRRHGR